MKLSRINHSFTLILSIAAFCVLITLPAKTAVADPDIPSARVAPQPHTIADQIKLADDYLAGRGVQQDSKLAAYWYEKAAGAGDSFAQFQTGYFYQAGIGVAKDPVRATHWYQLASSNGSLKARVNLGVAYLWGTGVAKNVPLAFDLIHSAAMEGSGLADSYLGDFYAFGIGVPQDRAKAAQWYRKGAELHDPIAEFDLASMLIDGKTIRQDLPTAAALLRLSAVAGYVPAKHELGLLLIRQPNLAQSGHEALALLNDAAANGNWRSSVLLGVLSRDGNGVPSDPEAAYYHFRLAALQGGDDAAKLVAHDLRLLSAKLGPERVQAMNAEASEWYNQHPLALAFVGPQQPDRAGSPAFVVSAADPISHTAELLTSQVN